MFVCVCMCLYVFVLPKKNLPQELHFREEKTGFVLNKKLSEGFSNVNLCDETFNE